VNWTVIIFCTVSLWAMLSVFGGERRRQLNEIESRKLTEEEPKE